MARDVTKKDKICIVCGASFKGIASAQTCTPACRAMLVRIKSAGKRPEFMLPAKSKGQKLPDLNAPKRLKFKKGEKKSKVVPMENFDSKIEYIAPTPESYDGGRLSALIVDEYGQTAAQKELNKAEILSAITQLHEKKNEVKAQKMPPGMFVRSWTLQINSTLSDIDEQIQELQSKIH